MKKSASVFRNILENIATANITSENDESVFVKLYFRNNPDGTPRWIWPASINTPVFLKFYNASSFKAQIAVVVIRILFVLRLQKLFASGAIKVNFNKNDYDFFIQRVSNNWSLFTGTAGVNRTPVFFGNGNFYKLAESETSVDLIKNEFRNIERWKNFQFDHLEMPVAKFEDGVLIQSDIAENGKRETILTTTHWNVLKELSNLKSCTSTISTLPAWQSLDEKITAIDLAADERIPAEIIKKVKQLRSLINPATIINSSYAHGDFTPWNMFVKNDKIAVIDWELAYNSMPCLYDAFHFIYQQASLADNCDNDEIQARIESALDNTIAKQLIEKNNINVELHHQLYLLFTITYYLHLYSQQAVWHPQVKMSLKCWNEALNSIFIEKKLTTQRQLLLTDIFNFLTDKKYAALKWLVAEPSTLREESDIDLCVTKEVRNELKSFLKQHPYVIKVKENRRSFMTTFSVILSDSSFISIDAILKFKRKDLIMLNAAELLQRTQQNGFGVKVPAVHDDLSYMWLFYLLNDAEVPARYKSFYSFHSVALNRSLNENFVWKKILRLANYKEIFFEKKEYKPAVIAELKKYDENKGWMKIKNKIDYVIDTLRDSFYKKGFIITFSGVDGAGKSTVIENVKHQIEKKFRRKVVVLRHRPAMLPMISGIKHGRKAAEAKAANTMPRQGNNKNIFSSIMRFGYYFADYFIGQFIVYIKYVLRGYVVLYDRYYFDFINDGKRSNIVLPSSFTAFWYAFLIKPKYNFFLYADADVILNRKKELDGKTIHLLTNRYLKLFKRLSCINFFSKYIAIENEQLPVTLNTILNTVKKAAI